MPFDAYPSALHPLELICSWMLIEAMKSRNLELHFEDFEKELEELSPLEDEVVEKQPKKKRALEGQDAKRREKKDKKLSKKRRAKKVSKKMSFPQRS
ncbi:protein MNN4-like [Cucumis melo var. makuwa]|uniref:Protein MNN4-like n=1 Tax=Cucumis melo var. makuwa TaxID=1194695 RepID=A0A5D3DTW9_CUCMM|nr:protein MNN4-like [Cucumis melo var. makuwa]TYK27207.1 protein MNN4-like [Cucumis melo var. makuwa]